MEGVVSTIGRQAFGREFELLEAGIAAGSMRVSAPGAIDSARSVSEALCQRRIDTTSTSVTAATAVDSSTCRIT